MYGFLNSSIFASIVLVITLFLWIFGEIFAFRRHWNKKILSKLFRTRLGQGFYAQFTSMFVGASLVFLLEYYFAPANELHNSAFYPYVKSIISIMLPATIFAGWEAGAPVTISGMFVTTIFNIFFFVNGLTRIGGALAFKVVGFIKRGQRMKSEPHYLVIGGNLNSLEIVIEQMTNNVLECRRKPITILLPSEQKDHIENLSNTFSHKDTQVDFFMGNILSTESLINAGIFDSVGIILLPTHIEDSSPDNTVLFCAKAIDRLFNSQDPQKIIIPKPHIVAKIQNQLYREILDDYVDQIICSENSDYNLVASAVFNEGLTTIFNDLIKISKDTNEIYTSKIPTELFNKNYKQVASELQINGKNTNNPIIVLGIIRDKKPIINPAKDEIINLEENDFLVIISSSSPDKQIQELAKNQYHN